MGTEDYREIKVGNDCLNPEMKRIRFETKRRLLEGHHITDDELLTDAEIADLSKSMNEIGKQMDQRYRGPCDSGPLTD